MDPDHDQVTAAAVGRLTENVAVLAGEVKALPERLERMERREAERDKALREREKRTDRKFRTGGIAVAVVALLLAATAIVFGSWNHHQDVTSGRADAARTAQVAALERKLAVAQRQNTAFREGFCRGAADIQTYLASAPAGPAAGRGAASRLGVLFGSLCRQPRP